MIKILIVAICACALLVGTGTLRAQEKKEAKKTCCETAKAKGEECAHKCCVAAHKDGKSCEKCNPNGEDKKKDKKKEEKKDK